MTRARTLAYERHGAGEPLVLVHGLTHRRQAWYPVLEELAEQREVILVDLPGHGASPDLATDGRPVQEVLRRTFQEFLADAGLHRPHVAGNSLGGYIALCAGAEGDARSVTALSPAGFWRTPGQFAYTRGIFHRFSALSDRLGPRSEVLARSRNGRRVLYGLLVAHPARISVDQAIGDVRAFDRARPALPLLLDAAEPFEREIPREVPVTVAWASRDLVLPPWESRVARERLPDAEHILMHGVGHVPMTDNPRFVAKVLLRGSAPMASVAPIRDARSAPPPARNVALP